MANDPKPSRNGVGRGTAKSKPRAGRSYASLPYSARSTVSMSKADRNPLNPGHSITKSAKKKDHEATYRKYLDVIDQA
ncbi:unnamed protein product [Penicillium camemberti]|uniref:Str. FM013 n=1 Tax=Penicillium camemberti (strain FM 013) TaxID=1429867 RepID=A0A0G4PUR1_PENC3|nr:unnamed protein product [Penicillium camemberti]